MIVHNNTYSIAELIDMIDRQDLLVNRQYQRGSGLWPNGPASYFIETILNSFPFPKIYLYEYLVPEQRRVRREIVDGQQRINTILRFARNEFALSGESKWAGLKFSDLDENDQAAFMSYPVATDVIRGATSADILQMFRRMNAYTLPLNEAEKRHSTYQGKFKWFVNAVTDDLNEFFVQFGVFTQREIVRMADAELVTEVVLAMEQGVVSSSPDLLNSIYEKYENDFPHETEYTRKITAAVQFVVDHCAPLRGTRMMKQYAVQTLIIALIHGRFGLPAIQQNLESPSPKRFAKDPSETCARLVELAEAHRTKDLEGPYATYVWGCIGGTNRAPRRLARLAAVYRALGNDVPHKIDAKLAG